MKKASTPVSIRLDPLLLRRAAAYGRRRRIGLTTALRLIISEHLDAADAVAELDAAMRWQRDRAWSALERWEKGATEEVSLDDLRRARAAASGRRRR